MIAVGWAILLLPYILCANFKNFVGVNDIIDLPYPFHIGNIMLLHMTEKAPGLQLLFNIFFIINTGYGHMTPQLRHLETQPFIVERRSCHLIGSVNLTDWYVILAFMGNRYVLNIRVMIFHYLGVTMPALKCCGSSWQKLLIGTADRGIKAWNVDAKRVVCDLNTTEAFPRSLPKLDIYSGFSSYMLSCLLPFLFLLQRFGHKVQSCRNNFCVCSSIQGVCFFLFTISSFCKLNYNLCVCVCVLFSFFFFQGCEKSTGSCFLVGVAQVTRIVWGLLH